MSTVLFEKLLVAQLFKKFPAYYGVQFPSHIKKPKYYTQNCNSAICAVWVRKLVSHFEGRTKIEGF